MPNNTHTNMAVTHEIESIVSFFAIGTRQLRVLQSSEFNELVNKNPDCAIAVGKHSLTIELHAWYQVDTDDPLLDLVDISDSADHADYEGYCVRVQEPLGEIHGVSISRRIYVDQRYTSEERELLRSMGRLQQQTHTSDTLVCGV